MRLTGGIHIVPSFFEYFWNKENLLKRNGPLSGLCDFNSNFVHYDGQKMQAVNILLQW